VPSTRPTRGRGADVRGGHEARGEPPWLLTFCLARLQWSPERLALEINKKYVEGTISRKAPYNWLKGARPRRHLPRVVAEILTERPLTGRGTVAADCAVRPRPGRERPCPALGSPVGPAGGGGRPGQRRGGLVGGGRSRAARPAARARGARHRPAVAVHTSLSAARHGQRLQRGGTGLSRILRSARKLADEYSYDESTGVQLHRIIAELALRAGWLAAELRLCGHSRSCMLAAFAAACTARDRSLAAGINA
jgi:hypothetical protein